MNTLEEQFKNYSKQEYYHALELLKVLMKILQLKN